MADHQREVGRIDRADRILQESWITYARVYTVEMRLSYKQHRGAWDALLARDMVTLTCFCVDASRCHRSLLAGMFGKLGAIVMGERPAEDQKRREL